MASTPPPAPPAQPTQQPPAAPKKTSPWVWVAIGCGGLLLLVTLVFVLGGLWLFKKGKDFVRTAEKNPAVAAAKIAAAADPDIEVVSADDEAGTVTLRNKKTGELITMDAKDIQKGRVKFSNEKGETLTVQGSEADRKLKIVSEKGEVTIGGEGKLPSWVPLPPGAKPAGAVHSQTRGRVEGMASFETTQSPAEVLRFYEQELNQAGFSPSVSKFEQNGKLVGGMVSGKAKDGREITITVSVSGKRTTNVALAYGAPRPQ